MDAGNSSSNSVFTAMSLFPEEELADLSAEQEEQKRQIYERMSPRRRKFIDKIGYEAWNPFQEPKEPLDLRRDRTRRTLQELFADFMRETGGASHDDDWKKGAAECAMGIFQKDGKYQGIFDFCLWYHAQLTQNGEKE